MNNRIKSMQDDDVMQNGSNADKQIKHFSYAILVGKL